VTMEADVPDSAATLRSAQLTAHAPASVAATS
jgi:hypothetical protein